MMNSLRLWIAKKLHFLSLRICPEPDEKPLPGETLIEYFGRLVTDEEQRIKDEKAHLKVVE